MLTILTGIGIGVPLGLATTAGILAVAHGLAALGSWLDRLIPEPDTDADESWAGGNSSAAAPDVADVGPRS